MTDIISIIRIGQRWQVVEERTPHSRLWFYAPGFEVYVRGEGAAKQFDTLANIAMNAALARHIPANSLKTAAHDGNAHGGQKPAKTPAKQQELFPVSDDTTE